MPGTIPKANTKLAAVPDVIIDNSGRFKYILCKIFDPHDADASKLVIRGTGRAEFHSDIFDELDTYLEAVALACNCLGGGKISHNSELKQIEVSGTSQGYGTANHSVTVDILRTKYPDYSITWSD